MAAFTSLAMSPATEASGLKHPLHLAQEMNLRR